MKGKKRKVGGGMPDAISILNEKKRGLMGRRNLCRQKYERQMAEFEKKLRQIDGALKTVEEVAAP